MENIIQDKLINEIGSKEKEKSNLILDHGIIRKRHQNDLKSHSPHYQQQKIR